MIKFGVNCGSRLEEIRRFSAFARRLAVFRRQNYHFPCRRKKNAERNGGGNSNFEQNGAVREISPVKISEIRRLLNRKIAERTPKSFRSGGNETARLSISPRLILFPEIRRLKSNRSKRRKAANKLNFHERHRASRRVTLIRFPNLFRRRRCREINR